jgi:hypothetical protein
MESPQKYIDDIYSFYMTRKFDDTCLFGRLVLPAHLASMDYNKFSLLLPNIGNQWALTIAVFEDGQSYFCLVSEDDPDEMAASKKRRRFV